MDKKKIEIKFRTDPVTVSVIESALFAVTGEMTITLFRTSRSPILVEAKDFGCAITNEKGEIVSVSAGLPIHTMGLDFSVRACLQYFGDEIYPGDVYFVNDPHKPFYASGHTPDFVTLVPVFYQNELVFWSIERGHQADTGAPVPGGLNMSARTEFDEGMRVTPVKLYEKGKLRRDLWDLIFRNLRLKTMIAGDLHSAIGSVKTGEKRLLELIDKYGFDTVKNGTQDMLEYSEALMRDRLSKFKDGTYSAERQLDGDAAGGPYKIVAKVTKKGDSLTIDYTGTDPQSGAVCNTNLSNTYGATSIAVFMTIGRGLPSCSGTMKPIKIIAPEGTMVNPLSPASTVVGTLHPYNEVIAAVKDCLSNLDPQKSIADWSRATGIIVAGIDSRNGEMFSGIEFHSGGGAGGNWGADGWHNANYNCSALGGQAEEHELYEIFYPHTLLYHRLWNDSGGPGKWRGGLGVEYAWKAETISGEAVLAPYADGMFTTIQGLLGGKGPLGEAEYGDAYLIKADGTKVDTRRKTAYYYESGDTLYYRGNGGAGIGNPFERDPESVRLDVMNDLVSIKSAKDNYGVFFKEGKWPFEIDIEATKQAREKMTSKK